MRRIAFAFAASVAFAGFITPQVAHAEAVKVTPEMTRFSSEQAKPNDDGRPTVLRGSATRRGTVDGRYGRTYDPVDYQLGAGAKLWLTDPESGVVVVCDERRTSRVGGRFIGCVEDRLPY